MPSTTVGPITRVMLFVHDVPKVAAYYRDILGLKPLGKIHSFDGIRICDGKDPEGNLFQIYSRGM